VKKGENEIENKTPFMSYGHVYYENGTVCNGSVVNITNLNTGEEWSAEKNASYNYYQRILANGTDLNASEILRFNVTSPDGSQSKVFNYTLTSAEINQGGLFNFSFALMPAMTAEAAHVANHVVISELFYDETGTDYNEFCELYNPTDSDIDIGGWKLKAFNQTGTLQTTTTFSVGANISAHKFYLIGEKDPLNSSDWGGTEISPDCLRGGDDWQNGPGDYIILYDDSDKYVDGVKYGSFEGSPEITDCPEYSNVGPSKSIERKAIASSSSTTMAPSGAHYTWGNGEDTDDNSADFITKTSPEPQNSSSAAEDCPAQSWFLSNVSGSGSYIMYKENMSKPEGNVTVADGGSKIWKANENATADVGFPAGTWDGKITLETAFAAGDTFTVKVGSYNSSSSNFTAYGTQMISGDGSTTSYSLSISASAFTVNASDYLALQINPSGSALVVKTGGSNSYAISPETDPGYPVPELPTLILFSSGLIILACYVVLKRRR
jgi:hypothetical protein